MQVDKGGFSRNICLAKAIEAIIIYSFTALKGGAIKYPERRSFYMLPYAGGGIRGSKK